MPFVPFTPPQPRWTWSDRMGQVDVEGQGSRGFRAEDMFSPWYTPPPGSQNWPYQTSRRTGQLEVDQYGNPQLIDKDTYDPLYGEKLGVKRAGLELGWSPSKGYVTGGSGSSGFGYSLQDTNRYGWGTAQYTPQPSGGWQPDRRFWSNQLYKSWAGPNQTHIPEERNRFESI